MSRMLRLANKSILSNFGWSNRLKHQQFSSSSNIKYNLANAGTVATEQASDKFKKDNVIQGFVVDEVANIEELDLTAIRLTHLTTGAQYLHIARDDSNNVFSIGFRTTPMDSTGLPHILEHTTLCGSERYPCRDPFFKMLRRSLATFMNAMTGPDYTIYPFSTQNPKDYRNLQSVYLDSVFKPNLREQDFRQEGWRLEHTDVNDKTSPIIFKGVVFNEMKGVFNENQAIFAEALLNSILPSHTYSVIAGGDPLVIPQLKHIDLVNFHSTYYHPSNSRFYSYGNFPLEDHLKFINDQYLFLSDRIDASMSQVPPEKRWVQPRRKHVSCRPDPMIADPNRQGTIAIGHLCNDITDIQSTFEIFVLSQLLLKGSNSSFYESLVESNIGTGFGPVTGFDVQCKDTMFSLSLQGVRPEDFDKVEKTYNETVEKVVEKGFEKDHVEGILHGIELSIKHQTSKFGLNLLFNLTPLWNHDGDLIQSLKINSAVQQLVKKMKSDPKYLQKLMQKYLMDNTHRLTMTMTPDEKYDELKVLAERKLLQSKLNELTTTEIDRIFEQGNLLLAEQQKEEDVGVLPTLKMEDLKEDVDRYQTTDLQISNVPVQLAVEPTNEISYYRAVLNIQGLPVHLKELVPLFNDIVTKMGTEKYDHSRFDQMVQLKTGGLHFGTHIGERKDDIRSYEEGIVIDSYCLDRHVKDMWELWTELFNNVKLDNLQRFDTLVKINAAQLVNGIAQAGHLYAMNSAASLVSPIGKQKEILSGLHHVAKMKKIAQTKDLAQILSNMQEIAAHVLNKQRLRSSINLCKDHKDHVLKSMETFYDSLQGTSTNGRIITQDKDVSTQDAAIHYVLPYSVNYASKAILTVPYTHPDYAVLRVLSKLITSIYLHPEIREKGGAYGGGANLTPEGILTFYSYRDPNSTRTLDVFDKTYEYLKSFSLKQSHIDEAKLSVFQSIDAPTPPSNRGMTKFFYDISYDDVQSQRQRMKAVSREQLMHAAEKYLQPGQGVKVGRALIGPSNAELLARYTEKWTVLDQEEEGQAQAAK